MVLKPNKNYSEAFEYDMSGIVIAPEGFTIIQDLIRNPYLSGRMILTKPQLVIWFIRVLTISNTLWNPSIKLWRLDQMLQQIKQD